MPHDREAPIAGLLPHLAFFVRVSVGLSLLNRGLVEIFAKNSSRAGGGNPFYNPAFARNPTAPGMDAFTTIIPYVELALSVGLIFGIFTTLCALSACLISLLSPLLTTVMLMLSAGVGPGMNPYGMDIITLFNPNQGMLSYVLLVVLSPLPINKFSIDALIFHRNPRPLRQRGVDLEGTAEITKSG